MAGILRDLATLVGVLVKSVNQNGTEEHQTFQSDLQSQSNLSLPVCYQGSPFELVDKYQSLVDEFHHLS